MNAIVTLNRVLFYCDTSRNGRFPYADITIAVNDVIQGFIDEVLGDNDNRTPNNFQLTQVIREDLSTLIKSATITPTNGTVITNRYYSVTPSHIVIPADYYNFVTLNVLIDGYTDYSHPTDYNQKGVLFKDSFAHPTNELTYFNEDATGLQIYRGVGGTFTSATLEYIRKTVDFSIGTEANLISPGGAVLTNGASYIATEISVQNAITYPVGTQFTATGTSLTSGQVILASLTSPIDLFEKTHDEICKRAAVALLTVSGNYPASQAIQIQADKS